MSRNLSRSLSLALVGASALVGAQGAAAATTTATVDYQCKYPVLGVLPVSVEWTTEAADPFTSGSGAAFTANFVGGGDTVERILLIDDLTSIEGSATAKHVLRLPDGAAQPFSLRLGSIQTPAPAPTDSALTFSGSGSVALGFDQTGPGAIETGGLQLNVTARDSMGQPILLPPVTRDLDNNPVSDSDGSQDTFDVYCKVSSTDRKLADLNLVGGGLGLPSTPPEVRASSVNDRSVFLQWDASTDAIGIKDYDVYQDGVKVKTVTTPQSSVTGLRASTRYSFQVRANAVDGRVSELSPALTVTTEELRWASANYTCKIGPFGTRSVRVAIEPTFPRRLAVGQSIAAANAGMRIEFDPALADLLSEAVTLESGDQPFFSRFRFEQTGSSTESGRTLEAPVTVPPTPIVPGSELQLTATAAMPSISAPAAGIYLFGDLVLQLIARDASGDAFRLDVPGIDGGGTDSDPNTFEMRCAAPPVVFESPLLAWVLWDDADVLPPTKPTNLVGTATTNTVNLAWGASTDNVGVIGYDVYNGDVKAARVTGTTATVAGLTPDTAYRFRVVAIDAAGAQTSSDVITVTTRGLVPPPPPRYRYALAGSASIKTLTKGSLPLTGSIDADLNLATGAFSADLVLADTQGRLTALGWLPVTAKIGFVPSGKTTGSIVDGVLSSNSKVRIKVKQVKLFGSIPLVGGNNCQTKSLSDINLKSTDEFRPLQGGNVAGTFAISDLNGCGVLNGLVSPLTAGGGNTITLKLTPKPTA